MKRQITTEAQVKRRAVELIKAAGGWYCFPATHGYGRSGVPDILACVGGRLIGIECKRDSTANPPTPLQRRELDAIIRAGGLGFVVDAHNVEGLALVFRSPVAHPSRPVS